MARVNKTGVRGLIREVRYHDVALDEWITAVEAKRRKKAGVKVLTVERWTIDLRWERPDATGKMKVERYRERLPDGITATAAKARGRDILDQVIKGTFNRDPTPPKRLGAALDEYLTWAKVNRPRSLRSRGSLAKAIKAGLGDKALDELLPLDVERYKRKRAAEGEGGNVGPATINREVAMLKHLCHLAAGWEWMDAGKAAAIRTVPLLKEPPGRVRSLTPDEEGKLLGALPVRLRAIALAADLSGMRRAEVATLRRDAVDMRNRVITLTFTKSNKVRRIPIGDELATVFEAALLDSKDRSEFLFLGPKGKPYRPDSISRAFHKAVMAAKITDLRFHDMRHDFATKVRRAGAGIDVIATLLGHADITTSARYAHVEQGLLQKAVAGLPAPQIAQPLPNAEKSKTEKRKVIKAVK